MFHPAIKSLLKITVGPVAVLPLPNKIVICFKTMVAGKGFLLVKSFRTCALNFSVSCCVNNKWRRQQGLEANPRAFGPLTNLPDFSFLDGRPVPLGARKKAKLDLQTSYCKRIAELTNEIDIGLEHYYQRLEKEKQKKEAILKNKLKPKGAALLKK